MWKVVGLAGLAGVAATGVAVARSQRQRRSYTPEEVRAHLHDRLASMERGYASLEVGPEQKQGSRMRFANYYRNGRPGRSARHRSKRV
jgi:hypothetical protein